MAYRLKDHQARIDRMESILRESLLIDKPETAGELSAKLGADYSFVCAALRQIRSRPNGISWIEIPKAGRGRPNLAYKRERDIL